MLIDSPKGIVLLTREQLNDLVRADLSELDLVTELVNERRRKAVAEDVRQPGLVDEAEPFIY